MTQRGKCDTCRCRKVKCDEIHPVCGPCKNGWRHCQYALRGQKSASAVIGAVHWQESHDGSQATAPKFDADTVYGTKSSCASWSRLSLKEERRAASGGGHFRTFKPSLPVASRSSTDNARPSKQDATAPSIAFTDNASIARQPLSSSKTLCKRWLSFLETASRGTDVPFPLGDWMEFVAPRIGHSAVLDSAVKCFVGCTVVYTNPDSANLNVATQLNLVAVRNIRGAIVSPGKETMQHDILISIALLHFAEVFLRLTTGEYICHQRGLIHLLLHMSGRGLRCTELMRRVFFHVAHWDSPNAVCEGRDSMFDEPNWLALPSRGYTSPNTAVGSVNKFQEYHTRHQIMLPRLARLVRQIKRFPGDEKTRNAAVELAEELYADDFEHWFKQTTERGLITMVPTLSASSQTLIPVSYDFASHIIHGACLEHWTVRIMTCDFLLALLDCLHGPEMCSFSRTQVASEDTRRAEQVMMCIQYAGTVSPAIPITALRHLAPLKLAWAAWHRQQLQYEAIGVSIPEDSHTRRMKECCVNLAWDVGGKWGYTKHLSDVWEESYRTEHADIEISC